MRAIEVLSRRVSPQRLLIGLGVATSLFVGAFDSFRLSSTGGRMNAEAAAAFLSPLYPAGTRGVGQQAIATLFVTAELLERLGVDPPFMPYGVQAQLVDRLAGARPAAIFLDFTYRRTRDAEGIAQFASSIAAARAAGVPVVTGPIADAPELAALRAAALQADVFWRSDNPLDYPFDGERGRPFGAEPQAPTAAKLLYDLVCRTPDRSPSYRCDLAGKTPRPDIAVEWARGAHPELIDWWGERVAKCADTAGGVGRVAATFFAALARNLFYRLALREGTGVDECTYHLSGPVDLVLNDAVGPEASAAIARHTPDPARPDATVARVVMVGSALGDDTFDAPGQGLTPGVLHHAMALDNLLSRGAAYRHSPGGIRIGLGQDPESRPLRIGISTLIEIALSLAIGAAVSAAMRFRETRKLPAPLALPFSVAAFSLVLIVPLAVALVAQFVFHWTAVNVFGVAAASLGVTALLEWERLGGIAVKWLVVGALATVALLALLVGLYVAAPGSQSPTLALSASMFVVALGVAFLAPQAPHVIPSAQGDKR